MKRYEVVPTKRYRKDIKRLTKSGYSLAKLESIIDILASGKVLAPQHRDHGLKGAFENTRECHISPDWLLRYSKNEDSLILLLISTGNHRHVLGIE